MSSHVVVLDGVDKIKSSSNPQVELVVDDTINNINDLQANKLNATAQAVDSAKLNGQAANYYATATDLSNGLNSKLNATAQAADSAKLGGQNSSYYAATTGLSATTDGATALGWTGTQFKVVPAGEKVITKRTGADGFIEFVFPTT